MFKKKLTCPTVAAATNERALAIPELHHRLQRPRIGQRQQPEQLRAAAALVQLHPNRFLLLLAHGAPVHARLPTEMQEAVAVGAQRSAHLALDDSRRLAVVVIGTKGSRGRRTRCRRCGHRTLGPSARGQPFDVLAIEDAHGGQRQPQRGRSNAVAVFPGQKKNGSVSQTASLIIATEAY